MRKFTMTEYGQKYCTGRFFIQYWNGQESVTELMTTEETLEHLIQEGFPFNICAELIGGGKTFAKLLTRWDEDRQYHWFTIAQLQGTYIVEEKSM